MCRGECNNKTCTCKYSDTQQSNTNEIPRQLTLMSYLGLKFEPRLSALHCTYHLTTEVHVNVL